MNKKTDLLKEYFSSRPTAGLIAACANRERLSPQARDALDLELRKRGLDSATVTAAANDLRAVDVIRGERRTVRLDKSRTLQELVLAGAYDYVDPEIEKSFDVRLEDGCVEVELEFVTFEPGASTQSVLRALAKEELRPGGLIEILSLGAQHPDSQWSWPIVALNAQKSFGTGDSFDPDWEVKRRVVCRSDDRERGRTLAWVSYDGPWPRQRFFLVRGPAA